MKTCFTAGLLICLIPWLSASAEARDWKVREVTADAKNTEATLTLAVSRKGIRLAPVAQPTAVTRINPTDVLAIWYDDKYVNTALGREWWGRMDEACHALCGDSDLATPLVLLAVGGVGYLAVEPFSERQHFVNIRYRAGDRFEWLTLGTTWSNHFWLMTDLSHATGLKWLNMPLQRAKLFWRFGDRPYSFQNWTATGNTEVPGGDYDVLLWEDGKGKGVLMVFSRDRGTAPPRTVAAEPVMVEGPDRERELPEYCRDADGIRRLRRVSVEHKRLVLPASDALCRGVVSDN
jgi:hypothetical protein